MNINNKPITARVTSFEGLSDAEITKWDELCNSELVLPTAFLSPHFTKAVSEVRPGVRVCVLEQNHTPVGFLPFQFRSEFARSLSAAERVGAHLSDYFGLITDSNLSLTPNELLRHANLSHLIFTHLDESQKKYGLDGEKSTVGVCYDITEGADAYWEQIKLRDKKFHAHTMRQQRRIERELGPLRLVYDVRDDGEALQSLIEQKRSQYAATKVKDVFSEKWSIDLLFRLYAMREPTCTGVLSALYAGDQVVSMHMGLQCRDRLHIWFPLYDPSLSRFSPGRLLLKALIDQSAENGVNVLDDGEATVDQMQKRLMGNSQHNYSRGAWHQPSVSGFLARADYSLGWKLAKLKRSLKK